MWVPLIYSNTETLFSDSSDSFPTIKQAILQACLSFQAVFVC